MEDKLIPEKEFEYEVQLKSLDIWAWEKIRG
jgi:hypothetical protein